VRLSDRLLLVVATAFTLSIGQLHTANAAERADSSSKKPVSKASQQQGAGLAKAQDKTNRSSEIYAPIRLTEQQNLALQVQYLPPLSINPTNQLLLSINGANLRGKNLSQVYKMLKGSLGDTVEIEVVGNNRQVDRRKILFAIDPQSEELGFSAQTLRSELMKLESLSRSSSNLLEGTSAPYDLAARAKYLDALVDCKDLTAKPNFQANQILLESILLSQSMGDLGSADQLVRCLLNNLQTTALDLNNRTSDFHLVVKNLVATDRADIALTLCQTLASAPAPSNLNRAATSDLLPALTGIPTPAGQAEADAVAEKLAAEITTRPIDYYYLLVWLCDYFIDRGKTERARGLYDYAMKSTIDQRLKSAKKIESYLSLTNEQGLANLLYNKAWLCAETGDRKQALADLQALTNYYNVCFTPSELATLNRLPVYFPTPEQVMEASSSIAKGIKLAKPPATTTELSYYRYSNLDRSAQAGFAILAKLDKALQANNKSAAEASASSLLELYAQQIPQPQMRYYDLAPLNLFCATLGVARAFSDNGWYQASDEVLDRLQSIVVQKPLSENWREVASAMTRAEQVVNASRTKEDVESKFDTLEEQYHSTAIRQGEEESGRVRREDSWRVKLRLLAMGYYRIGDNKRAKIFIDRALLTNLPSRTKPGDRRLLTGDDHPGERFSLLMNTACNLARLGDLLGAAKYAALAGAEKTKLDEAKTASILEYAQLLQAAGKTDEAIDWLTINRTPKMEMPFDSLRECVIEHTGSPKRDDQGGKIDEALARCIANKGDYKQAYQIITDSAAKSNINSSFTACVLAGELAQKCEDFGAAAAYFEGASLQVPPSQRNADTIASYQQKAVDMAERAGNYDSKALSKLYIKLAQNNFSSNPKQANALYKKAVDILPDSDPGKAQLISLMSSYGGSFIATTKSPLTAEDRVAIFKRQTVDLRNAAVLAEKNNLTDAYVFWLRVAENEAQAGQLEQAVSDAKHAFGLYNSGSKAFYRGQSELTPPPGLTYLLIRAGAEDRADELHREALEQVKKVQGAQSIATQWQLTNMIEYFIENKKYDKALSILDELLNTNLAQGPYTPPYKSGTRCYFGPIPISSSEQVVERIYSIALSTIKDADNSFAVKVLSNLLAAQNKQLKADDWRIGVTYGALAKAYYQVKSYEKALTNYDKALAIFFKYEPEQYAYGRFHQEYPTVLKALGKQSVLDEIEKRKTDKARKEIEERDKELLLAQQLLKRLESEKIGINAYVVKEHSLTLKSQKYLAQLLDNYKALTKSSGSKLELIKAAKQLEKFGDRANISVLQTKFMAVRVTLEESLKKLDEEHKREAYTILIARFILDKDIPAAKIWLAKLGELDSNSTEDDKYLTWLEYSIKCGDINYPTPRSQKIEQALLDTPIAEKHDYHTTMLRRLQELYSNVGKAKGDSKLEAHAAKMDAGIAQLEKLIADTQAQAKKAREEYLNLTPLERAERDLEKTKLDFNNANWTEFERDRRLPFSHSCQLPEIDRSKYALRCLAVAQELVKAHKSGAADAFLAAVRGPVDLANRKEIVSRLEEIILISLQLRDRRTADLCIRQLAELIRTSRCTQAEIDASDVREKAFHALTYKWIVNDVALANESQVRELANGYRINRSILAWQLLRINDKNNYSLDNNSSKTAPKATFEDSGRDKQPLLLEADTHQTASGTTDTASPMAPFKPAQSAPANAKSLDTNLLAKLPAGDYVTNKLEFANLAFLSPGKTRIFIQGDRLTDGPAMRQRQTGPVSSQPASQFKGNKQSLEIWYNGEGTIQLDDGFDFSGLLYAPFARVELNGPTTGRFSGAIVARDVIVAGNVNIKYDPAYEYLNGQ